MRKETHDTPNTLTGGHQTTTASLNSAHYVPAKCDRRDDVTTHLNVKDLLMSASWGVSSWALPCSASSLAMPCQIFSVNIRYFPEQEQHHRAPREHRLAAAQLLPPVLRVPRGHVSLPGGPAETSGVTHHLLQHLCRYADISTHYLDIYATSTSRTWEK